MTIIICLDKNLSFSMLSLLNPAWKYDKSSLGTDWTLWEISVAVNILNKGS